jgi:hypothetical protein
MPLKKLVALTDLKRQQAEQNMAGATVLRLPLLCELSLLSSELTVS